jgi:hypothetical protein
MHKISIVDFPRNIEKAYVLGQLFNHPITSLTDIQETKIHTALEKYGWKLLLQYKNVTWQTHERWIERYQNALGVNFQIFLDPKFKNKIPAFIDKLADCHKTDYEKLLHEYGLMSSMEKLVYKNKIEHIKKFGDIVPEPKNPPNYDVLQDIAQHTSTQSNTPQSSEETE